MKAVILASGGLDSTVTAALARQEGYDLYFLTITYGQRNHIEVTRAQEVGKALNVSEHRFLDVDLGVIGGSALTDEIQVPKDRVPSEREQGIPVTFVPGRNSIFLSLALGYAERIQASAIFIGVHTLDYSGYPDCRPEFLQAFQEMARLGSKLGEQGQPVKICAPVIHMTKTEIIQTGNALKAPLHLTHSCYDPLASGVACGRCDSCLIRLEGFRAAGLSDAIPYAISEESRV